MMFLPFFVLGLLGLAAAASKAKAQGGVHAYAPPALLLSELLDAVDNTLDELGNFSGNAQLTDAQRTKLHALMAPYKASGEMPTAAQVLSVLKQVLNTDQLAIVRAVVPQLFTGNVTSNAPAPGSAAYYSPVTDPRYKPMLDKLDDVLDQLSSSTVDALRLTSAQLDKLRALMAPYKNMGTTPLVPAVCAMLNDVLTAAQVAVVRATVPGAYFLCNADAGHAVLVKVLNWIGTMPSTFFRPGVQGQLTTLIKGFLAQNVMPADLPALLQSALETASYQQILFDIPELTGSASSSASTDATKQAQATMLASYVQQLGISAEQDAQLSALFSPFTALGKMPPPEIVCSAMAHVLTPEQLSNFSRAMPAFSQACS